MITKDTLISVDVFCQLTGISNSDQFVAKKQYPIDKVKKTAAAWNELLKNDFVIPIQPSFSEEIPKSKKILDKLKSASTVTNDNDNNKEE